LGTPGRSPFALMNITSVARRSPSAMLVEPDATQDVSAFDTSSNDENVFS